MGSRKAEEKLVVVKHRPGAKLQRRLIFIIGVVLVGTVSFLLGNYQIKKEHEIVVRQLADMSQRYALIQDEENVLRQRVANLQSGREIDELAKLEIQETIRTYEAEIAQLEKDLSFYQNIMAPSDNARGLQVQKVDLKKSASGSLFEYKIVLAQVADNKSYVSGKVAINIIGMEGEQKKIIPLRDVSEQHTTLGIKFKFKYFQDIKGDIKLPESFVPTDIQIVAQSKGKKASRLEQSFDWKILIDQKS